MTERQLKALKEIGGLEISEKVSLKGLTSFHVGGDADILICPRTPEAVAEALKLLREEGLSPIVLGRGTNTLFSDEGCSAPLISPARYLTGITLMDGDRLNVEAGATLKAAAAFALDNDLTGLEFAHGIPGTLGGGVFMNAGAYGGCMADVTESVELYEDGEIRRESASDMAFGYRTSRARRGGVVLSAVLKLAPGDPEAIRSRMRELQEKRRASQPLEYPSAGSFFKRPEGHFAGALIDGAGLKGVSVGGAMVSPKHAGFVINTGDASCADILALKDLICREVRTRYGVDLEMEVAVFDREGRSV